MGLSTGARAGLTSVAKALSGEVAAANVTINNLLPERFDTAPPAADGRVARRAGPASRSTQAYDHMKTHHRCRASRPTRASSAHACAFLCSAQAGFISGQNLQLDGGSYGGLL